MPLPTLTPAQRAAALEKAAQTRTARAQARAQLRSGELSPLDVLRAPTDSPAGDLRVEQLLVSLPGIGKTRATALLAIAGIPSTRRVRSLRAHPNPAKTLSRSSSTPPTAGRSPRCSGPTSGAIGRSAYTWPARIRCSSRVLPCFLSRAVGPGELDRLQLPRMCSNAASSVDRYLDLDPRPQAA
jgi:hypothetical protein